ncbi:MAG: type II toxin-antitoxin system RelE/ParE family toxin [Thermoleophilia bacterium]|nr:type II toxin-antitoxin system RelE/ParE family toxin [Thermoleophilia bacterium]
MAREVVWTDPAWNDLESAADYIARDSVAYAAAFVQEVKAAAASLSEFAERGQVVPEFGDQTIRELLVKPYRLVYRISPDHIAVLALVHGATRTWRT